MQKIINPLSIKIGKTFAPVFCKIEFENGNLAITGVVAPNTSGNCRGGCGQIYDNLINQSEKIFTEGWNKDLVLRLVEVWKKWHLNDMKAGCEHQEKAGWGDKDLKIVHLKLRPEVWSKQDKIEEKCKNNLRSKLKAEITKREQKLLNLPYTFEMQAGKKSSIVKRYYITEKIENKKSNWVEPSVHEEGVLGKPCPVCGYEYGSAWKRQKVPKEVIAFINSLPETKKTPAWI